MSSGAGRRTSAAPSTSGSTNNTRSNSLANVHHHHPKHRQKNLMSGLRKVQLFRRKTIDNSRIRQPLMEEPQLSLTIVVNNNSRSDAEIEGEGATELTDIVINTPGGTAATAAAPTNQQPKTTTIDTITTTSDNATTTTTIPIPNSIATLPLNNNLRNGSNAGGTNGNGVGVVFVTTTAVPHSTLPPTNYNNNVSLDANKMADDAL